LGKNGYFDGSLKFDILLRKEYREKLKKFIQQLFEIFHASGLPRLTNNLNRFKYRIKFNLLSRRSVYEI